MGENIETDRINKVVLATLDGKAYYKATSILKSIGVPFMDMVPSSRISASVKLVLTSRKEISLISHDKTVIIEDLDDDPRVAREEILRRLYGEGEDTLMIGIDPGERIGIVAYYRHKQIDEGVVSSVDDVVERVNRLIRSTSQARRTVRIGDGTPYLAKRIAEDLVRRWRRSVIVELVDERGTSSLSGKSPNKKMMRDLRSAVMIASRQGRRYYWGESS